MRKLSWIAAPAALATMAVFNLAPAQQPAAPTQPAPASSASPSPASPPSSIEPDAIAALNKMGDYLRSLKVFSLRSETTTDEITDDGMKLQFGGTVTLQVQRPNRLRAEVNSDRKRRQFFYDGKTLTLYGAGVGYYATVPAPPTLRELAELAQQKYDVRLPLVDLFYWGSDAAKTADIKEAAIIGPGRIDDAVCDHVAIRQEGVDWQIWIERGKTPLPRKLVITTTSEPSQPQYVATMRWNLAPRFGDATFRFSPPKGAHKIPLQRADGAPAGQ